MDYSVTRDQWRKQYCCMLVWTSCKLLEFCKKVQKIKEKLVATLHIPISWWWWCVCSPLASVPWCRPAHKHMNGIFCWGILSNSCKHHNPIIVLFRIKSIFSPPRSMLSAATEQLPSPAQSRVSIAMQRAGIRSCAGRMLIRTDRYLNAARLKAKSCRFNNRCSICRLLAHLWAAARLH